MIGDVKLALASGTARGVRLIVRNAAPPNSPVNVTGWSAELRLARYNGTSPHGATFMVITATAGTTNGLLSADISAANATTSRSALVSRIGRWSFWATPPSQAQRVVGHGDLRVYQEGEPLDDLTLDATIEETSLSLSALAIPGPAGATGPTGPQGPTGTVTVNSTEIETTTTAETVIQTLALPLGYYWTAGILVTARKPATSELNADVWEYRLNGKTLVDGTTTFGSATAVVDPLSILGAIKWYAASAALSIRALPAGGTLRWTSGAQVLKQWPI